MPLSNDEAEEFMFRRLAENVEYMEMKNVKTTMAYKWANDLRIAGSQYSPTSVRHWINSTMRLLKKGQLPQVIANNAELSELSKIVLKKMPYVPPRSYVRHSKLLDLEGDELIAGIDSAQNMKQRHYSAKEQEHLLTRLAERVEEVQGSKHEKSKFYNDMAAELSEMGFSRSSRSIQRWINSLKDGKLPLIAQKESLSWAVGVVNKAFHLADDSEEFSDDEDDDDDPPALTAESLNNEANEISADWRMPKIEKCDYLGRSLTPDSTCSGLSDDMSSQGTTDSNDSGRNLRTILEQLAHSTAFEIISCMPYNTDDEMLQKKDTVKEENISANEMVVDNVIENYKNKKLQLEAARKRKMTAEKEADEYKKKMRDATEKACLEAQQIRYLEEDMELMKEFIQANTTILPC